MTSSGAVARYKILGGNTVNRGVGNGGAQLNKSQNIGWVRAHRTDTALNFFMTGFRAIALKKL